MYLTRLQIENIRCLSQVDWCLDDGQDPRGWHVVLGDNGAGKSTLLRCASLSFLGPVEAEALREDWPSWIRRGAPFASVNARIIPAAAFGVRAWTPEQQELGALPNDTKIRFAQTDKKKKVRPETRLPLPLVWTLEPSLFSAAYGPFRRFEGAEKETKRLYESRPRLARHLSLYGEHVSLGTGLDWLVGLDHAAPEFPFERGKLEHVKALINSPGFLPNGVKLTKVSSRGIEFKDASDNRVKIGDLSDGYKSVLALTLDLVQQMSDDYLPCSIFSNDHKVIAPAICIIDEVDVHLHPTWQTDIGPWMVKYFPNTQFLVSTHSPLVCQAADSVFRLPNPATGEEGGMVKGTALDRLRLGNILDAYSTGVFGDTRTRSAEGEQLAERLAALNVLALSRALTPEEAEEQARIRRTLPTAGLVRR